MSQELEDPEEFELNTKFEEKSMQDLVDDLGKESKALMLLFPKGQEGRYNDILNELHSFHLNHHSSVQKLLSEYQHAIYQRPHAVKQMKVIFGIIREITVLIRHQQKEGK